MLSGLEEKRHRFPAGLRRDVRFFAGQLGAGQYGQALALARAERWRRQEGAFVAWEPEPDPMYGDLDDEQRPQCMAMLYSLEGVLLESLGAIDATPGDPYCRLVEAELAQEALAHLAAPLADALMLAAAQLEEAAERIGEHLPGTYLADSACEALEECSRHIGEHILTLTNGGI